MANDVLQSKDPSEPRSTALLPTNAAENSNGEWSGAVALVQPAGQRGPDLAVYVHAMRRHWLVGLGIGLLCAAAAGVAVWLGVGTRYTASSYLRVDLQEKSVLRGKMMNLPDRDRFEIYKNTQRGLLLSRFVLIAALRNVAKIPVIQSERDPADWLQKRLSVSFPGRAELMQVSLTRKNPKEAAVLVAAVVNAYLVDVVDAEGNQKRQRLSELETVCAEKEGQIRTTRRELKNLAQSAGSSDTETITLKQKLALEELTLYRREMARTQFEVRRMESEWVAQKALLKAVDAAEVPIQDLEFLVQADPVARQLSIELGWKKMDQVYTNSTVKQNAKSRYADRYGREVQMLQEQYDKRVIELAAKARSKKRATVELEIVKLDTSLTAMKEQYDLLAKEVSQMKAEAEKFGGSTVDIEMLRSELKQLELMAMKLNNERDEVRVEIRSTPRITLLERAEAPTTPSNRVSRIALTVMAILGGLCGPMVVIALVDSRTHRINTADDVSKGLRLPVIGSVPLIPSRVIRHLGSPVKQYKTWQVRLTESVDGITARLLRKADVEQCRVIMVSSAAGGEGKTTLATQLALSLARTGRRVVLVDFDLRRPAFDEVFGVPLEPGVCEMLRRQNTVSELVHPDVADNLAVVTAGRWDRPALAALSNNGAAAMFRQLRQEYDFVVVDTSPILPVADARFVSQHVDAVVLSVLRDISKAPKIQAACDILAAFGVPSVEAVVTGQNNNLYGKHMGYESTISA